MSTNDAFEEELLVLKSIYGDDSVTRVKEDKYPFTPPSIDIRCACSKNLKRQLENEVGHITSRGNEVMLYAVIDHIRQRMDAVRGEINFENEEDENEDDDGGYKSIVPALVSEQRPSTLRQQPQQEAIEIHHGDLMIHKKSSFQSHFSFVRSLDDINNFRSIIATDKRYSSATHNIFCYRFTCKVSGLVYHDYDDDGETAAGGRLAEMLRLMTNENTTIDGGIALIVSRWFGGILLGPERFKYINNSARILLEKYNIGVKK